MGLGLREKYLRSIYRRWPSGGNGAQPGYTLLMTVPPDLPMFFQLAIDVCARQDLTNLVETLVIPDRVYKPFRPIFEEGRRSWPAGRMRLVELRPVERLTRRIVGLEGGRIHWLQIVSGVNETRTTHALLHDVDLFLLDGDFLRTQYEECVRRGLGCMGLQTRWPMHDGLDHLMGPWEIMFELEWMRGRTPFEMCPQNVEFPGGKRLWADSTMYGQYLTPRERLGVRSTPKRFIHFESVLWNYRRLQAATGPFEDGKFSILFIRLLIEAYDADRAGAYDAVPTLDQLARGIHDATCRVTYLADSTRAQYATFRARMEQLTTSGAVDAEKATRLRRGLAAFDEAFDWAPNCDPGG